MRGRILLGGLLAAVSLGVAAAGAQTNGPASPAAQEVDGHLPARPLQGTTPLLLESEVRAFFANGLAAPLPSSQRLFPD